jgi:Pyruvate/2-oxoacid:ferredoxin oxidoreductase delta subunit
MGTNHSHRVCTFQEAESVIKAHDPVFVNECFCRGPAKAGKTAWPYCGHSLDTCMGFHPPESDAQSYPYKQLTQSEALDLFEDWIQKGNFFRFMENEAWLCFCCKCGCGWFRDKEGRFVEDTCEKSPFIEKTHLEDCTLCGACLPVCAYEARSISDDTMKINSERCFGCSACEYICPEKAISMVKR